MAWRRSSSEFWSEFDEMLGSMQKQFGEVMERLSGAAQQVPLPGGGTGAVVDVMEHDADVVVVADLPGVETQGISVRLIDPRTLRITARREEMKEEEQAGYHVRERRVGAISRTVSLPTDVRGEEAHATFKNGVLEVRLKKVAEARGKEIPVGAEAEQAGQSTAEMRRQQIEEEYREDREKVKPSGYSSPRDIQEAAQKIQIEDKGSPEEQEMAAKLRKQKEELYKEGKRKLAG
ncbi:MAG: Heat shock protein Hsp20 [Methanoculleus marisnigri]|jgi:Molecular chaperone (small heat shock protein)|uniref:Heat shock protein Hsp20 n=1 Tax=Methanoculleus marisnigri TaxID=2198 RepID=A0A101GQ37_9EURY|nr:Hsp20/alpha crystallin family protein [Methanoculleus marisnigri]KUK62548.1 MAG: Heat shock protein Hsp20 [Methanoculleus marisnigri]